MPTDFSVFEPVTYEFSLDGKVYTSDDVHRILGIDPPRREPYVAWHIMSVPEIKKVIFNYPATIVLWEDGTKTVVKVKEDEEFDEWAGLAFCICKKLYGDQFHKVFRKYCDPAVEQKKEALALFDAVKKITGFSF